jgi:hypothetical protein
LIAVRYETIINNKTGISSMFGRSEIKAWVPFALAGTIWYEIAKKNLLKRFFLQAIWDNSYIFLWYVHVADMLV